MDVTLDYVGTGLSALALHEILPDGFSFSNLPVQDFRPGLSALSAGTEHLGFMWGQVPPFPFSFYYLVDVSYFADAALYSGYAEYRLGGGPVYGPEGSDSLVFAPWDGVIVTRTLSGPGLGGPNLSNYVPGANIDVLLRLDKAGDGVLNALGCYEALPDGWTLVDVPAQTQRPDILPDSITGELGFAWVGIPAFPVEFSFTIQVDPDSDGDAVSMGPARAVYRYDGGQLEGPGVTFDFLGAQPYVRVDRYSTSGFYRPGEPIEVRVGIYSANAPYPVSALGLVETLPSGWTFAGLPEPREGDAVPFVHPAVGATGRLEFAWLDAPSFPVRFGYLVRPNVGSSGVKTITGYAPYRLSGGALRSPEETTTVPDEASCASLRRTVPAGCYKPGVDLEVHVTVDAECHISALGVEEDIPEDWTFVDAPWDQPEGYYRPHIVPGEGETGRLEFIWMDVPEYPVSFMYIVRPDAASTGDKAISGSVMYRLGGGQLYSPPVTTAISYLYYNPPPVITLTGSAEVTIECSSHYRDAGATAMDEPDGDLTSRIVVTNPVNVDAAGEYTVRYNVTDSSGHAAVEVTRSVIVRDTQIPAIWLLGEASVTVECGGRAQQCGRVCL